MAAGDAYPLSHMDLANSNFATIGTLLGALTRSRRFREPRPWLAPLIPLYWLVTALHRIWMLQNARDPQEPQIPLVVIGALRAGGSGKTSVTLELARHYRDRGLKVAILAYRLGPGTGQGGLQEVGVDGDWRLASDEAVLLRRMGGVPVFAVRNRLLAWRRLEAMGSRPFDLLLSDDGFQDPRLRGAYRILLSAPGERPGLLDLLPAGPYRETWGARRRADLLLEGPGPALPPSPPEGIQGIPHDTGNMPVSGNPKVSGGPGVPADPEAGLRFARTLIPPPGADPAAPWSALCGLGDNRGFLAGLAALGYVLRATLELPDHAAATEKDLMELSRRNPGAGILCTRKDFLKLEAGWAERFRISPVDLDLSLDAGAFEAVDRYLAGFRVRKGEFGTLSRQCVP